MNLITLRREELATRAAEIRLMAPQQATSRRRLDKPTKALLPRAFQGKL